MKKIWILILLTLTYLEANNQYLQTDLKQFSIEVLSNLDKSFVIQDEMLKEINLYYKPSQNNYYFLKQVLKNNGFEIKVINDIYYINKIDELEENEEEKSVRYIDLNFLNYNDIESICKLYNVDFTYLKETNKLAISSTYDKYKSMKEHIKNLDKLPLKTKLKISIFETDLSKVKEHEGLVNLNLSSSQKAIFDIFLGSAVNITNQNDYNNLNSVLKFMNTNSFSRNVTSTIVNLEHNKKFSINSARTIPVLTTTNTVENTTTKEINSYTYQDVGLNLTISPKVLDNLVNFDMIFKNTKLISNDDNLPITSGITLNQNITLTKFNKIFVLSGINNESKLDKYEKIPLLSSLPLVGNLFSNKYEDKNLITTTILVELIDFDFLNNMEEVKTLLIREFDSCKYLNLCD